MRFRTFAWLAVAVVVIAGNTAFLLWVRPSRARNGVEALAWSPRRVAETPVAVRPVPPAEVLPATAARVRVAVRADGSPVAGATVRVLGDRPGGWSPWPEEVLGEGITGADGIADLPLPRWAGLLVRVAAEGFARAEVRTSGDEAAVDLVREGVLRVRVLDAASGAPLEGAAVTIRADATFVPEALPGERPPTVATGSDGVAEFRGLAPGDGAARARQPGRPWCEVRYCIASGAAETREIRLPGGVPLRGRVVFAGLDRSPAEGRVLRPLGLHMPRRQRWDPEPAAVLDREGRFVLEGIQSLPTTPVHLRVEAEGRIHTVQGQRPVVDPATGAQVGEIQVPIPGNNPDPGFEGTVTGEDGRPVEGALVVVGGSLPSRLGRWMRGEIDFDEARTDAAGRWRTVPEHGPGGASQVLVLHPEYAPVLVQVPSRMRKRTIAAALARGATLLVKVRDAAGRPAGGAEVVAQFRHPNPDVAWQDFGDVHGALRAHPRTDAEGRASVAHVGPGPWYLVVRTADGRDGARVLVDVPPGEPALQVEVSTAPLPVVHGVVRERSGPRAGEPLREIMVLVPGDTPLDFLRLRVDPEGRFESPPLLPPACMLVDGKVPVFFSWVLQPPGEVVALATPGEPVEVLIDDRPAPPQAR